jgi:hypothetical protein
VRKPRLTRSGGGAQVRELAALLDILVPLCGGAEGEEGAEGAEGEEGEEGARPPLGGEDAAVPPRPNRRSRARAGHSGAGLTRGGGEGQVALNHLKRLRPQRQGLAPGDAERLARVSRALHAAAARDMPRLGPRHLALAVNAAVPRPALPRGPRAPARAACGVLGGAGAWAGGDAQRRSRQTAEDGGEVLTRASRRVVGMAADPVRDYAFDEQAVTMCPSPLSLDVVQ